MALSKKMVKNIINVSLAIVVVVIGLYIYNVRMISKEEAKIVDIRIPVEMRSVKNNIDVIEKSKLRWKDAVTIIGWVVKENNGNENRDLYLVLRNKDTTFIFKAETNNLKRPDVTKAMKLETKIDGHGFNVKIPIKALEGNTFNLGFILEDETGKYFVKANKKVTFPDDNSEIKIEKLAVPAYVSNQVALNLGKPNAGLNYSIDQVEKKGDYVAVNGWGFLKGMDATSSKIYVLLKKNGVVKSFDVKSRERDDVAKVFSKEKLNLHSVGFSSNIPVDQLEKGVYKVGLFIISGNNSGIVFGKKTIDIPE